jgi:two-component sensor histidine kinase
MQPNNLQRIRNLGIKPSHQIWEAFLIRKLNFISLIAFVNMFAAYITFPIFGITYFQNFLLFAVIAAPAVALMNIRFGYVVGTYGFFLMGATVITYFATLLGPASYSILYLFPIIITLVQILGRRETMKHLFVLSVLYFGAAILLTVFYSRGLHQLTIDAATLNKIRNFNIIVSALTTILFVAQITAENSRQEQMIRNMVKEKDVLVAEVFHRVKNNMNIVTSLLNLKKNSSDSDEVRNALQDCRNRVFSMALVHERIFQKNDVSSLDFGEYVHDLADEIIASLGLDEDDSISVASDEMELPISQAIPCGLIVNEVITNSCKHARIPGRPLKIKVELKSEGGKNVIRISDNGPGADENSLQRTGSLGIDLIKSLCQQIDAKFRFEKKAGLFFEMSFN